MIPDEASIFCSRCSGYNIESECCICKDCMSKLIDKVYKNLDMGKTIPIFIQRLKKELGLSEGEE